MNIVNSFTNRSYGYVRGLVTLILGLVLVCWPGTTIKTIVMICAASLIVAGVLSFYVTYQKKETKNSDGENLSRLISFSGLANLIFGILLFAFPSFFISIIMYLFAFLLLVLGIGQILNIYQTSKIYTVNWIYYILPTIISLTGTIIIINPFKTAETIFIFIGIVLLVYSISELLSSWKFKDVVVSDKYNSES